MRAGELDRLISLTRFVEASKDGFNDKVGQWAPLLIDEPASRYDVSDAERLRAAEVGASITTRFKIRWSPDIDDLNPRDRLTFEGRDYDIAAVKQLGRREGIEITATARAE